MKIDSYLITHLLTKTPSQAAFVSRMSYIRSNSTNIQAATILHFVRMQRSSPMQRMYTQGVRDLYELYSFSSKIFVELNLAFSGPFLFVENGSLFG